MKQIEALRALGLAQAEAVIYIALLQNGAQHVSGLARLTRLYRPTIYRALTSLEQRQLLTEETVGRRTMYAAEAPKNLRGVAEALTQGVAGTITELEALRQPQAVPSVRTYHGRAGIGRVYEEIVDATKRGGVIYRYESPRDHHRSKTYYPPRYRERAIRAREIEKFVITNEKTHRNRRSVLERLSRFVPAKVDSFDYDVTMVIYSGGLAIIDYQTETATLIVNSRLANFQRQLFRLLFDQLGR
ncbi:MAG: hypothetical protein HY975_00150 [Candidatus Kerfeldbacteria bacterium]|nr:hypothetical protein [Candidatus Kerfeldbacteria bacterium]